MGSWLSNPEAPSVFSVMQSSLTGESDSTDKLTVCVNTPWKVKDVFLIGTICLSEMRLNMGGERNSCSKNSVIYC